MSGEASQSVNDDGLSWLKDYPRCSRRWHRKLFELAVLSKPLDTRRIRATNEHLAKGEQR